MDEQTLCLTRGRSARQDEPAWEVRRCLPEGTRAPAVTSTELPFFSAGVQDEGVVLGERPMSEGLTREEVHDAVDRAARELLDEFGVDRPPVDTALIAARLGVAVESRGGGRGRGEEDRDADRLEHRHWLAARALWSRQGPAALASLGVGPD